MLNVWTPFYDDLDQLKAMVATLPDGVTVYAVDGRHDSFPGETDLTPGAKEWCATQDDVHYYAPERDRLPWGHEYDNQYLRGPQHEKAKYANYEVLPQDEWVLKLDTDERVIALDTDQVAPLDPVKRYSPPIDQLVLVGYHPTRLYVPEHWTFWLADQFYPRDFYPRDTPVEELIRAAHETSHGSANVDGFFEGAYIENHGEKRPADYRQRREEQLEHIGRRSLQRHDPGSTDQRVRIRETDWDVLVVLDAFRWDYWEAITGSQGAPVQSPESCTPKWIGHLGRCVDFSDTLCITGNPVVTRQAPITLTRIQDLSETHWRAVNGVPTVDPYDVTWKVIEALEAGSSPVYAHYMQPHGPYPKVDPPIAKFDFTAATEADTDGIEFAGNIAKHIQDDSHWLTRPHLLDAYQANAEWVWAAIQPLLDREETVVVTADHGELLAERVEGRMIYGHNCPIDHEHLRTVPWAVYD